MNTEQKAKAYDKAIEQLRTMMPNWENLSYNGKTFLQDLVYVFPELKESEDERIRKGIIDFLWKEKIFLQEAHSSVENNPKYRFVMDAIAWLEKQGHTDGIIEKAKTEKQRVIITETDGNANIDWDTRSLQDVKLLLEYGLDYIKKLDEKNCLSNTKHSMGDLKIISSLKNIIHTYWNNLPDSALEENEVAESCYRWLEKQGETFTKKDIDDAYIEGMAFAKNELEKQGQKPTDKVESRFKIGDWIVDKSGLAQQVLDFRGGIYTCTYNSFTTDCESNYHLWTIEDAKDDDVLVHNGFTFIFKGIEDGIVKGLCSELSDSILNFGEPEHDKDYYPATKEQRYFLFQKMKETGYEWDSMIDWLKSLKQRNTWKPSDEQMKALHDMNLTGNISYAGQGQVLIELYNDLKKL